MIKSPVCICDGCKYHKFKWFQRLIDGCIRPHRCNHPEVLKIQEMKKNGFCSIALQWPCQNGKLKETKK